MSCPLATLFTITTYGSWLRGDARGWVDDGRVFPPDPQMESEDRRRMKYAAFGFEKDRFTDIGQMMGDALRSRLDAHIFAMTVQTWHVHVLAIAPHTPSTMVKCAKDAVRWGLRPGRPIWSRGYDKRYCFDEQAVRARTRYVERHNTDAGLPARPWTFIERI